jgi:hypothetical protein
MALSAEFRKSARTPATATGRLHLPDPVPAAGNRKNENPDFL